METSVPEDVQRLLFESIEGYEHLEVLLLLHDDRGQVHTPATVASKLRMREEDAEPALAHLGSSGFLEAQGSAGNVAYKYHAGEKDAAVGRLADAYRDQRLEIMKLMNANALTRVRTSAIKTFADAFVWRKKDG